MKQTAKTFLACLFIAALVGACAKKQVTPQVDPVDPIYPLTADETAIDRAYPGLEEATLEEADADISIHDFSAIDPRDPVLSAVFKNIHFGFDQFSLAPEARATLDRIAAWMKQNPDRRLLIEGHCDERGTSEYNLALGERRANSAKRYLVQLGISPRRVTTVSYGEERPLVRASNEAAWAQNRRGEFKVK